MRSAQKSCILNSRALNDHRYPRLLRTPAEKSEISKIARRGRRYWKPERPINPVCVLTGYELLSHFGPPYCWKELKLDERRFRHIVGLMEFCNATQQIHLGLPSWEEDWHKKWERRRTKLIQKRETEINRKKKPSRQKNCCET